MISELKTGESLNTEPFGDFSPYYFVKENQVFYADKFDDIFAYFKEINWVLDETAVLSLINFDYILGDRTLVNGIKRIPWHSTLKSDGTLIRETPIEHSNNIYSSKIIAAKLICLLEEELYTYIKDHNNIWILQTGGLDSRVVLGVLISLIKKRNLNKNLQLITWGDEKSRDVIYSRMLADHYKLNWHHVPFDANILKENIEVSVDIGAAEVSPFHYHAMMKLKDFVSKDDCVIAASYGDSIGRAEYSGSHLLNVKLHEINNNNGLFNWFVFQKNKSILEKDRASAWVTDREQSEIIKNELDMQENYMRRMISHAMNCIRTFTNLRQAFTSKDIVSYVFSIAPFCRNSDIYFEIFKIVDPYLSEIPWARTGISPSRQVNHINEPYKKDYHDYDNWFFNDYKDKLEMILFKGHLINSKIINKGELKYLHDFWRNQNIYLSQLFTKIYIIELFIKKYNINVNKQPILLRTRIKNLFI